MGISFHFNVNFFLHSKKFDSFMIMNLQKYRSYCYKYVICYKLFQIKRALKNCSFLYNITTGDNFFKFAQ